MGRNVRKLRKKLQLSQVEFAERSGYHCTYVASVERGERNITLNTLAQFASALKIDPVELLKEP
jgi:transcriptional regulator with XRE-family HTH domain